MSRSQVKICFATFALLSVALLAGCSGVNGNSGGNGGGGNFDSGDITKVNHIVFMLQENRSFDHYFGHLNDYRTQHGAGADVDGTPANAAQMAYDKSGMITPFHLTTKCIEDLSSYWNESHNDWNHEDHTSNVPLLDGFAFAAGGDSRTGTGGFDFNGQRVMGYYTSDDLPYYYFMATQFAMSDRWFSPVMTNTPANRMYAMAATSQGVVNKATQPLTATTIFDELSAAGITWKNYVPNYPDGSSLKGFPTYAKYVGTNIVPMDQYFTDLKNGTLPQVAFLDRDSQNGLDEHPGYPDVQRGAAYVKTIIDALMQSSAWKDSIFFLSFDEAGGLYDHVAPVTTVSPDGIKPILGTNDVCTLGNTSAGMTPDMCDFDVTGYRLPNFAVSPFSRPKYVDHQPMDTTAILKFIEKRFNLKALTKRDAAQPDISNWFDFTNSPNLNPPSPPSQPTSGPCYIDHLP